jgi:serine/threonine protein kinase
MTSAFRLVVATKQTPDQNTESIRHNAMLPVSASKRSAIPGLQLQCLQTQKRAYQAAHRVYSEVRLSSKLVTKENVEAVARLGSSEVIFGEVLRSCSFCHVVEVERLDLDRLVGDTVDQQRKRNILLQCKSDAGSNLAVKFLRKDLSPDQFCQGAAELVNEMHLLSALRHPNIIQLRGVSKGGAHGFHGSGYFICTERLHDSLESRMSFWRDVHRRHEHKGKRDPKQMAGRLATRLQVAVDIASALAYLHANKVVYRDMNPANMCFDVNDSIRLVGFRLARELEDGFSYQMSGSNDKLCYQAPEIALSRAYDTKADVFSFTIMLWQLCSMSETVYNGIEHRGDYIHRVVTNRERPSLGTKMSDRLRTIISNGWNHKPADRPTMQQMKNLLMIEVDTLQRTAGIATKGSRSCHKTSSSSSRIQVPSTESVSNRTPSTSPMPPSQRRILSKPRMLDPSLSSSIPIPSSRTDRIAPSKDTVFQYTGSSRSTDPIPQKHLPSKDTTFFNPSNCEDSADITTSKLARPPVNETRPRRRRSPPNMVPQIPRRLTESSRSPVRPQHRGESEVCPSTMEATQLPCQANCWSLSQQQFLHERRRRTPSEPVVVPSPVRTKTELWEDALQSPFVRINLWEDGFAEAIIADQQLESVKFNPTAA